MVGPLTASEVRRLIADGVISRENLAISTSGRRITAGEVEQEADLFASSAPPALLLPPVLRSASSDLKSGEQINVVNSDSVRLPICRSAPNVKTRIGIIIQMLFIVVLAVTVLGERFKIGPWATPNVNVSPQPARARATPAIPKSQREHDERQGHEGRELER
jgi:hypothetical protein